MLTRLSILCVFLFATGTATACSCGGIQNLLANLKTRGFPPDTEIFHGKVEWSIAKFAKVRVIEAFSGGRQTRLLSAATSFTTCDLASFSDTEAIYFVKPGFFSATGVVEGKCSVMDADPQILDQFRAIAQRYSKLDRVAQNDRVQAAARAASATEEIFRSEAGTLFKPVEEASVQQLRSRLPYLAEDKIRLSVHPVHINRLAIDAPVTVFEVDGKSYRFVGNMPTTKPPLIDLWRGQTSSGDRATVFRKPESMSGQIEVGGRLFIFETYGELGFGELGLLHELSPTVIAERWAEEQRREAAQVQSSTAQVKPSQYLSPENKVLIAAGMIPYPTSSSKVPSKMQQCFEDTRLLLALDVTEKYRQPAHMQSWIGELRGRLKEQMLALRC
jgi:hypothetical protein